VTFLEAVPADDMPALYRDHNLLVFPSTGPEGLPVSILEAMACGLAVVATDTGGTAEIIEHGVNGLLCAPDDADALARMVRTLRQDAELRRRLGARARVTIAERFNASRVAGETEQYLRSAIHRFRERAAGAAA
jgi:glycosyltransferase involved in cell wall biosynthesis